MNFFEKTAKPFWHSNKSRLQLLKLIAAQESFQQPGAHRVQVFNAGNVDDDVSSLRVN